MGLVAWNNLRLPLVNQQLGVFRIQLEVVKVAHPQNSYQWKNGPWWSDWSENVKLRIRWIGKGFKSVNPEKFVKSGEIVYIELKKQNSWI